MVNFVMCIFHNFFKKLRANPYELYSVSCALLIFLCKDYFISSSQSPHVVGASVILILQISK